MAGVELKPGSRWKSANSAAEVVVVRPPKAPAVLACGGVEMVPAQPAAGAPATTPPAAAGGEGVQLGKRYVDDESGIELLCVKGGEGALSVDGRPATLKEAKRLPSSD